MAASFSAGAKTEICRLFPQRNCCALAQSFGVLLYANTFTAECIKIITESRDFSQMLPKLFRKAFGITFDQMPGSECTGKAVFLIEDPAKLDAVLSGCGFSRGETLSVHVNLSLLEEDCCKAAFLRGAFLAGGSVTDPSKGYHLEMATTHQSVARQTFTLIREVLGVDPKSAARGGGQVLYFKQSDVISDLLTLLGAPVAAMGIMEAKLEKGLNNRVNRCCNCDDANISKVIEAAQEQIAAIQILRRNNQLDNLPKKIYEAAIAREMHPDASLSELAAMMEPPISKPAMNHRMKNIVKLSKEA